MNKWMYACVCISWASILELLQFDLIFWGHLQFIYAGGLYIVVIQYIQIFIDLFTRSLLTWIFYMLELLEYSKIHARYFELISFSL